MRLITAVANWIDSRLQLGATIRETMEHPVPRESASWAYVFGSAALTAFALQVVTGILLALVYVPSAGEAWNSLQTLNHHITLGWFIRALHGWGSNFMIAIVLIHMVQVFLFGAYKFPRELTWVIGVLLLLVTLGMAFTGQVLRFDQDAYWGLGIGASIASRVPVAGPWIVDLMLGGPIIAGATLSRFFALHVFVIPGLLIAFVAVHVLLVLKLGVNEWPMPGRIVRRATYLQEYHEITHRDGVPFVPNAVWKDIVFSGAILLAIGACAVVLGPFGPSGPPDPTIIQTAPRPDFFFLWLYGLLSLLPPSAETPILLIAPADRDCRAAGASLRGGRRREELEAQTARGADGAAGRRHARHVDASRRRGAVEPVHERVERQPHSCAICERTHGAGAPGRARVPEQAVPQLPRARRRRRETRSRARCRRRQPDAGSTRSPGDSRRRQHARVRTESESRRDQRARRVPADDASARADAGARCGTHGRAIA